MLENAPAVCKGGGAGLRGSSPSRDPRGPGKRGAAEGGFVVGFRV